MTMEADVVIVGAGPTGLMLACELRLAGIATTALERILPRGKFNLGAQARVVK